MHLFLGEQDLGPELGPGIAARAAELRSDPDLIALPPFLRSTSLLEADSESAYLDRAIDLLRRKSQVDTLSYPIPHRRGLVGRVQRLVRMGLWKLLRYQHDRMAFRHNLIHSQTVSLIEFQRDEFKRELAAVKARLDRLERGRS